MHNFDLIKESKWKILKELSKQEQSASDISKKTGQTLANTTIQLQTLEKKGMIKKLKKEMIEGAAKKGKPKKKYVLTEDLIIIGCLGQGLAEKKIKPTKENLFEKFLVSTMLFLNEDQAYAVTKYCMDSGLFKKAHLIGLLKAEGNEVELFIVTSDEHLESIRTQHSNASIETPNGKTKKIISWSHTNKEVTEGIGRGEHYFLNLIKANELLDKHKLLMEWGK